MPEIYSDGASSDTGVNVRLRLAKLFMMIVESNDLSRWSMSKEAFCRPAVNNIVKLLSPIYPYVIKPESNNIFKISSGLLVLSKYPILNHEHYFYDQCESFDCLSAKGFIVFSLLISGENVTIVNTHNQSDDRFNLTRVDQYSQLKEVLDVRDDDIQIIGGDLNSNGFTYDVNNIESVFDICIKPYDTCTWSDNETHCVYDYIFINKDVSNQIKYQNNLVLSDSLGLSDHRPIKFSIKIDK